MVRPKSGEYAEYHGIKHVYYEYLCSMIIRNPSDYIFCMYSMWEKSVILSACHHDEKEIYKAGKRRYIKRMKVYLPPETRWQINCHQVSVCR